MWWNYFNPKHIISDVTAGLTLGIESIPDAMASALLAAVNPINGIYAVMLATPVGALFASSVFMSVQTTSALSLIVASVPQVHTGEFAAESLLALAILTGLFMIAGGLLKLGTWLRFVPNAVMTGFINGIALLIILGQLGDFTGYAAQGSNKITQTIDLLLHIEQIDLPTLAVGLITIAAILTLEQTQLKSFGLVLGLVLASMLAPLFDWQSVALVRDIADIPNQLPRLSLPPLSVFWPLIIPAISIALVGLIQGAGISQNYANPDGRYPNASRDFIGQGAANVAAGLFQGMPVGGSLSATALVVNSGARTRFANIFAGITMAVTVLLLGGLIGALAMPSLAGLLIIIGFRTLKPDDIQMVWKTGRVQQIVLVITFVGTLLIPLQFAVLIGVAISVLLYVIRQSNRMTVKEWLYEPGQLPVEQDAPQTVPAHKITLLAPYGSLFFAAVSTFEEQLPTVDPATTGAAVILRMRGRTELGSTFLEVLQRYATQLQERHSQLMLTGVSDHVKNQFEQTGAIKTIGRENVFPATGKVLESTLAAIHAAETWIAGLPAQDGPTAGAMGQDGELSRKRL